MIEELLPKEEEEKLRAMFLKYDKDRSNTLEKDEFIAGMIEIYGCDEGEEQAEARAIELFNMADTDNSGVIDFTEFKAAFVEKGMLLAEDKLFKMFTTFDEDKSGKISTSELQRTFASLQINSDTWEDIIKEQDENNDGEIDFDEFKMMMKSLIQG